MSKLLLVASLSVLVVVLYLVLYFSFPEYEIKNNESYKFEAFKLHYNKEYTEEENSYRYSIFLGNLNYINEYNSLKTGVVLGINKFADLTKEEFDMTYKGYIAQANEQMTYSNIKLRSDDAPDNVDWRTQGAVTPIKDQGQCGSCWAFSTVFTLEGIYAIKSKSLKSFSEQQLVDCSLLNMGCSGGNTGTAMDYEQTHGVILEQDYPYTAVRQSCQAKDKKIVFTPASHTKVQPKNNDELASAVVQQPVSICIEADSDVFQYYTSGVIKDKSCGTKLDHCVGLVGYENDPAKQGPYWIVKNSWGLDWGEQGYVRILKESGMSDGICGIAKDAIYANFS